EVGGVLGVGVGGVDGEFILRLGRPVELGIPVGLLRARASGSAAEGRAGGREQGSDSQFHGDSSMRALWAKLCAASRRPGLPGTESVAGWAGRRRVELGAQRPLNAAGRFSMKARRPST